MIRQSALKSVPADYLSVIHKAGPQLLNAGEHAVFQTDLQFQITGWNNHAEELCGRAASIGQYLFDFFELRFTGSSREEMLSALWQHGWWSGELLFRHPDGSMHHLRVTFTNLMNEAEGPLSILVVGHLISDIKLKEQELEAAESKFQALVNSLPGGYMMIGVDGLVKSCNKRGLEIIGLDEEEVIGKVSASNNWNVIRLNGTPFPLNQFPSQVSLQTGFPQRNVIMGVEQPGGHRLWLSVSSEALIRPGEFEPYAALLTFSDITQFILTEQELMQSNERFHHVTRITSDAIWDFDLVRNEIYRSETFSRLSGYSPSEIGSSLNWWFDRVHPEDRNRVKRNLEEKLFNKEERWEDEYRFEYADGGYKVLNDRGLIFYQQGKPVRILGAICDITEKSELTKRLALEQEEKHRAVAIAEMMAQENEKSKISRELHDNVNQILMSAKLYMESARQLPEKSAELLDKAIEYQLMALQEIRKISRSLSIPGQNSSGLQDCISDIVMNLENLQQLKVNFQFDPLADQLLNSDEKLAVYRVLQEQSNNIIKYANATEVMIRIAIYGKELQLDIADNGKGFEKGCVDTSKGIGLFNMQNRARAQHGSLSIQAAPGKGCRIEMRFPLACYSPTITNAPQKNG